jgi:hypothetical protein
LLYISKQGCEGTTGVPRSKQRTEMRTVGRVAEFSRDPLSAS